jgi:hypothetical protein
MAGPPDATATMSVTMAAPARSISGCRTDVLGAM